MKRRDIWAFNGAIMGALGWLVLVHHDVKAYPAATNGIVATWAIFNLIAIACFFVAARKEKPPTYQDVKTLREEWHRRLFPQSPLE